MNNISDVVIKTTNEMISNGTVERLIAENIEKTIADSIESALESYSNFGRSLTEKIEESIQTASRYVDVPAYNQFIKEVVNEKFSQVLQENAVKHLEELIGEVIEPITKNSQTSQLINKIQELWTEEAREHNKDYIEITSELNDDETALYVTINHPEYDWESVKVTFYNFRHNKEDTWHIGYINQGDSSLTKRPISKAGNCTNALSDLLFKYYAMGTEFELDQEFYDIDVCGY